MASQQKDDVWVLGGLKSPKMAWDNEHIPTVIPGCSFRKHYHDFITSLDCCNLYYVVNTPTRGENFLDHFLTSNHALVKMWIFNQVSQITTWYFQRSVNPVENKQLPISAYMYRKADWEGFEIYMDKVKEDLSANFTSKLVEELLTSFTKPLSFSYVSSNF